MQTKTLLVVDLGATGLKILIYILSSKSSHECGQKIGEFWRKLAGEEFEAKAYKHNIAIFHTLPLCQSLMLLLRILYKGVTKKLRSKRQESMTEVDEICF